VDHIDHVKNQVGSAENPPIGSTGFQMGMSIQATFFVSSNL